MKVPGWTFSCVLIPVSTIPYSRLIPRVGGEKAVQIAVDAAAVYEGSFTLGALATESELLGDSLTSEIVGRSHQLDAVDANLIECEVQYSPARLGRDPIAHKIR